jgi:hypothetical protein
LCIIFAWLDRHDDVLAYHATKSKMNLLGIIVSETKVFVKPLFDFELLPIFANNQKHMFFQQRMELNTKKIEKS